ncbi:MAG: dihydroorotate dehydrogenase [Sphingobacteriales bacterium]
MYKLLIKPLFFSFNPESAHKLAMNLLKFVCAIPGMSSILRSLFLIKDKRLERTVFGITFPNPVGLAAGFDKDATYYKQLSHLGFGFIEIGTVTPLAQPGNPQPRLFRLPKDNALINRMGFNNDGVVTANKLLKSRPKNLIICGNIGKNKVTLNENANNDYLICFNELYDNVDYFVVNVSSPNTPGLRELQDKEPLLQLLQLLVDERKTKKVSKPILLKIAPDLSDELLNDIIFVLTESKIDGVIATNTTISREGLKTSEKELETIGKGGLSGLPVKDKSTKVIKTLRAKLPVKFPIIAVGGIHSAEDALEKLDAGADLIQLYTGFIYEGPGLIKKINKELLKQ